jgi:hypothetical protein
MLEDTPMATDGIRLTLRSALRTLPETELSPHELGVAEQLLGGRRTIRELVLLTYDVSPEDEGYRTCYMRVRRALITLEGKGMVSSALFGKAKPYRLTRHAIEKLLAVCDGGERYANIVKRIDYLAYSSALGLSLATLFTSTVSTDPPLVLGLAGASLLLTGISVCRLLETLRRVL